ncbi:MAG TPA: nucleotidyltransferase domain-containing protein [archaeon]|nr:nucleotidyltransferase domain-containing protein [archaeon]
MSKNIDKILELFVEDSYRKFNVREVARLTKLNPSTASKYLALAHRAKMLKMEKARNFILFSADLEGHAFRDLKVYKNIKKIRNSGLLEFIENELNYPEAIILFGSYAKGENRKDSDIDLFILSESGEKLDIKSFETKLETEIQVFCHSRKEMERMKVKNKELLNNILNGIKLSGFFEVFR